MSIPVKIDESKIFEFILHEYSNEYARFNNIRSKAGTTMTILALLLTASIPLFTFCFKLNEEKNNLLLGLFILFGCYVISLIINLVYALKIQADTPITKLEIEKIKNKPLGKIIDMYNKKYIQKLRKANNEFILKNKRSFLFLRLNILGFGLFFFFSMFLILYNIVK